MKKALRTRGIAVMVVFFLLWAPPAAQAQTTSGVTTFPRAVLSLANADRAAYGAQALTESALLNAAAQKKAEDMARRGYFAHISPEGAAPWQWFTSVGYRFVRAGENLAVNFEDPKKLESAWMASPGHRANILKGNYTEMGVGIARGTYFGRPATFVVQFFATPAANAKPALVKGPAVHAAQ